MERGDGGIVNSDFLFDGGGDPGIAKVGTAASSFTSTTCGTFNSSDSIADS